MVNPAKKYTVRNPDAESQLSAVATTGDEEPSVVSLHTQKASLLDYVSIARPDHWFKNIFVIPGVLLVPFFFPVTVTGTLLGNIALALFATCLVASSNYVINEILDAEPDRHHPVKRHRPLAAGRISIPIAYAEWIALGVVGVVLGFAVNFEVGLACLALWIMGCVYNIPPVRSKEVPYLDVLSESVNNPIRMTIGWYAASAAVIPPVSALFSYWMFGAFLMATKRFAEYRRIGDPELAGQYRASFQFYNEERLLAGNVFYVSLFMTGAMAFVMLYRLELVFAIPFFAYLLAYYVYLGFREDSPVQYPEKLYREKHLMAAVGLCSLWCVTLLFMVDLPWFEQLFTLLTPAR
jgi:4-hydroxybenzoate polyprenyltransferase